MENRFEHTPPEEQQGWGAYATPPPTTGFKAEQQAANRPILPHDVSICERVKDKLPYLLENSDGLVTPDAAKAIYGHLSICEACSREFDEHQRVAAWLESVPHVELPMDFSGVIQRRITIASMPPQTEAVVAPGVRAFGKTAATAQAAATSSRTATSAATVASTLKKTRITSTHQLSQVENGLVQRFTAGAILAAMMASFVNSGWGREMLGENITTVRAWLDSVGAALGRIPVFGRLALLVFTALAQVGDLLGDTYRTVGDMAVRGLAMDIGVCIAAYYFLVVRRQRDASWIRRA